MIWAWVGFIVFVLVMLAIDLGVFHKVHHVIKVKEAMIWSVVWIALAMIFNGIIYHYKGREPAIEFFAGYVIEKSLSVDNLFVFLLIFDYFKVPGRFQHEILFWGVIGALVLRGLFIWGGIALISRFDWLMYVFGAILIYSGIKIGLEQDKKVEPDKNPVLKLFKKFIPMTTQYDDHGKFWIVEAGKKLATPLLAVLIIVETTDVIFAVDSIPAIFAITLDPFIVFTSNVFAILGLRSLYFALSGAMQAFHRLNVGLAAILVFVGFKMLIADWYHFPTWLSLGIILTFLSAAVAASLAWPGKK